MEGFGKPVLLIHGWAMHSGVWSDFIKVFSSKYKIVTMDLRGHGKSVSMGGPYNFSTFAEDIIELIAELKLKAVTCIGWSMGASILLKMFDGSIPEIDSVVLISGNPSLIKREDYEQGIPIITVKRLFRQVSKDYPRGLQNFYDLLQTPQELPALQNSRIYSMITDRKSIPLKRAALESLECLWNADLRYVLKDIHVPTLIIHGCKDRICVPSASQYLHERIRNSQLLLLGDTGHIPFITKGKEVCQTIQKFLNLCC